MKRANFYIMQKSEKSEFNTELFSSSKNKSGFIAVIGKPNVGKSTLVNNLVGKKVAIISSKPQTTRHRILGVKNMKGCQMVFVDTPGVHEPEHELGRYMEKAYKSEIKTADLAIFIVEVTHPPTDDDFKARDLLKKKAETGHFPVFLVVNKIDLVNIERLQRNKEAYASLAKFDGIFEVSALTGKGLAVLTESIYNVLPAGPAYFPPDVVTDQSLQLTVSEIVREKVLMKTRQEVPHSVFVHTEEIREGKSPGDIYMKVVVYVERESQKGILIGKDGARLKEIGTLARQELESFTGKKIFLDLWVKVKEDWKDRKDLLKSWGYEV